MATGPIKPKNAQISVSAQNIRLAYWDVKKKVDTMVAVKGAGNDWAALAAWLGEANATDAQTVFDNMDAALAYLTSANDVAAKFDGSAL